MLITFLIKRHFRGFFQKAAKAWGFTPACPTRAVPNGAVPVSESKLGQHRNPHSFFEKLRVSHFGAGDFSPRIPQ